MKALSFELENKYTSKEERESLFDEIITLARSLRTTSMLNSPQITPNSNSLQMEHSELKLNLKLVYSKYR